MWYNIDNEREVINKAKTDLEMGLYNHGALTESFIRCVENQPTADVVEVVRCKDCKHLGVCATHLFHLKDPNSFCSHAERREEWHSLKLQKQTSWKRKKKRNTRSHRNRLVWIVLKAREWKTLFIAEWTGKSYCRDLNIYVVVLAKSWRKRKSVTKSYILWLFRITCDCFPLL